MPVRDDGLDQVLLHYTEHNPSGHATVLLIHGALTSGQNWDLVVPHLAGSYHLLVPDLPGHGQSRNVKPFSAEYAARLLERLIRKHAHNGKAHVVGHSLGANVAIELITSYPQVVSDAFVSGFAKYPPSRYTACFPYGFWVENRLTKLIPRPVVGWVMDGTDLGHSGPCSMQLCRQVVPAMVESTWPSPWPARTLIVAAGKSGILPTSDRAQDARKLMDIGEREEWTDSRRYASADEASLESPSTLVIC
ncbi:alpha hydrolase-19 [Coleophoma crateriformis]|uniref:Alpha hydrolase-19 n=1 Tax=Coleophoma crateriformis TaxID=565419 RepID=A0A3D8RCE3_9HELO|nr:alpha hydrolase-19 [Coleophoma crateriformis]